MITSEARKRKQAAAGQFERSFTELLNNVIACHDRMHNADNKYSTMRSGMHDYGIKGRMADAKQAKADAKTEFEKAIAALTEHDERQAQSLYEARKPQPAPKP